MKRIRLVAGATLLLLAGAAAFGEFLAPSVCANRSAWCTCADLRDAGLADVVKGLLA